MLERYYVSWLCRNTSRSQQKKWRRWLVIWATMDGWMHVCMQNSSENIIKWKYLMSSALYLETLYFNLRKILFYADLICVLIWSCRRLCVWNVIYLCSCMCVSMPLSLGVCLCLSSCVWMRAFTDLPQALMSVTIKTARCVEGERHGLTWRDCVWPTCSYSHTRINTHM